MNQSNESPQECQVFQCVGNAHNLPTAACIDRFNSDRARNGKPFLNCRTGPFVVTGDSLERRHLTYAEGHPVTLTNAPFVTLLQLVCAIYASRSGFLRSTTFSEDPDNLKLNIHRLRLAIDRCLGPGSGFRYITTGTGVSYRLAVPLNQIYLDDTLFDLPSSIVPAGVTQLLREIHLLAQSD